MIHVLGTKSVGKVDKQHARYEHDNYERYDNEEGDEDHTWNNNIHSFFIRTIYKNIEAQNRQKLRTN